MTHSIKHSERKTIKSEEKNSYVTFWRPTDQNGYLGQWYESDINIDNDIVKLFPKQILDLKLVKDHYHVIEKLIEYKSFNTAEKFMMMAKSALFHDDDVIDIMEGIKDPKKLKSLGRKVKNFSEDIWQKYNKDIVIIGNYLKFTQNKKLGQLLKKTGNAILVEGCPMDKLWGVGLRFDSPNITDKSKWKGENYLGNCLMFVRELL